MNTIRAFACLAAVLLASLSAWAQTPLTPKLEAEVGLFPGCTVTQAVDAGTAEVAILDCGKSTVAEVAAFYKAKLVEQGYKMEFEDHSSMGSVLVAATDAFRIAVDVAEDQGGVSANLTLDDLSTAAGDLSLDEGDLENIPSGQGMVDDGDQDGLPMNVAYGEDPMVQHQGPGVTAPIWELVEPRPGDEILEEVDTNGSLVAMLHSKAAHESVLEYYREALLAKGWQLITMLSDSQGGMVVMSDKQGTQLQVMVEAAEPDQPMEYSVILSGL